LGGVAAVADAASTDGIATLLDTARRTFGPVDIYVANAGIGGQSGLGDDEAAWDQIIGGTPGHFGEHIVALLKKLRRQSRITPELFSSGMPLSSIGWSRPGRRASP
jgi:NAD(P)-dependent dehydrogenase (short-subunit alcohol dehydrogenase family)